MRSLIRTGVAGLVAAALLAAGTACGSEPAPPPGAAPGSVAGINALLPEEVRSSGVIRVGTRDDAPPGTFKDASGTVVGFEVDLMNELSKILGVRFEYSYGAVNTLIPGLQASRYQAANGSFGTTPERQQVADFVSYAASPFAYVEAKDKNLRITALADLCGHTVAVALGTQAATFAQDQAGKCAPDQAMQVSTFANTSENLLAIKSGRADVYFTPSITAIAATAADPTITLAGTDPSLPPVSLGISFLKGSPLTPAFQAAVDHLIQSPDGTYQKILTKWDLPADFAITSSRINPER